ncbi:MAG TPA: prepilin-type N-terminal cleavage/methylation domain-containing protein, partial [Chthoniobacteraceae bacterium]|nr:prepilin-type N-terminal cleavage/methylation domain-containing protein [Chthoniobacteraceae bacterium]
MTRTPFSPNSKRAFTLIELIIVIVVVAILVALLLPAFTAVVENGRTTKCANNLRQIGNAMALFAN